MSSFRWWTRVRGAVIALVVSAMWSCVPSSPPGWRQYDADGFFTFVGPPDLKKDARGGIDSYAVMWRGSRLAVRAGVAGVFGGGLAMGVRGKKITVGGRGAMLYVDSGVVSPMNPTGRTKVGLEDRRRGLYVLVECDSAVDVADAIYLAKSVRYTGLGK